MVKQIQRIVSTIILKLLIAHKYTSTANYYNEHKLPISTEDDDKRGKRSENLNILHLSLVFALFFFLIEIIKIITITIVMTVMK